VLQFRQARIFAQWNQFAGQFLDNLLEVLRVKDAGRFRKTSQGKPSDRQRLGHLRQTQRLLQHAERIDRRVEEIEQDRRTVIAHKQPAIAGGIPLAANFIESMQQRHQPPEVLEADNIRVNRLLIHGPTMMPNYRGERKLRFG
jgi:hypothetical protein